MGIDALGPGFEVIEWDQGIYETLPVDRRAFRRIKERQVSKEVYGQIWCVRSIHYMGEDQQTG